VVVVVLVVVVGCSHSPVRSTVPVRVPVALFDQMADTVRDVEVASPGAVVWWVNGVLLGCGPAVNGDVMLHVRLFVAHDVMVQLIWYSPLSRQDASPVMTGWCACAGAAL